MPKLVIYKLEQYVSRKVAVDFWSYFEPPSDEFQGYVKFYKAVEYLYSSYLELSQVMNNIDLLSEPQEKIYLEESSLEALKLMIRAALLAKLPSDNKQIIENFYEVALKQEENRSYSGDEECRVCRVAFNDCNCGENFYETNRKLAILGLLEPLVGQVLTSLIYVYIENYIQKTCKDNYDVSHIEHLETVSAFFFINWYHLNLNLPKQWLDSVVINWLKKIYYTDTKTSSNPMNLFIQKLTCYLYETFTKIQINQLFNIIIEFPESLPALEDLRQTLQKTDLRSLLTSKLQKAMELRLLHIGVSTPDILTAYVAAIRSMRILDPSGMLLETVTQPVHQYLRSREDTVR